MDFSSAPRHHALSTSEGVFREESEFDFLARQRPSFGKLPFSFLTLSRFSVFVSFVSILIILAIVFTRERNVTVVSFEAASCLYPLGGGKTRFSLPQPRLLSPECVKLFKAYFAEGGQYWVDTETAVRAADDLLKKPGNYSMMVVFDIDETALSNVPLALKYDFDTTSQQRRAFIDSGTTPAIPAALQLYNKLRKVGFSVTFLTGRRERDRNSTIADLKRVGYGTKCKHRYGGRRNCYYKLIMRDNDDRRDATIYKSAARMQLEEHGFEIIGSVGDQWSDLLGDIRAPYIIKMPNPMYYSP